MNVRFIPVRWGSRQYLVDEMEMPGFCAASCEGKLPIFDVLGIHGLDYVKLEGNGVPPLQGEPLIPERFRTYYFDGPVEGRVLRIDDGGEIILDKGAADRVEAGMVLLVERFSSELTVLSAGESESRARASYYRNSRRRVEAGDRFTSGDYFHRPRGTGFERFPEPSR